MHAFRPRRFFIPLGPEPAEPVRHEVGVSLAHEEGLVKYDPDKVGPDELRPTPLTEQPHRDLVLLRRARLAPWDSSEGVHG